MSAQESFTPYGPAAYRAGALPDLAPAVEESGGIVDTPLKWGHYAGLDSPIQIKEQLEEGKHLLYETQAKEGRKQLAPCDVERWRFDNAGSAIVPKLIFLLQLAGCGLPWICWSIKVSVLLNEMGSAWEFAPTVVGVAGAFSGLWLMSEWRRYAALAMGLAALTTASLYRLA
ncbi:hypothetical protein ACAW63_18430 [Pseudomonas sp. QE6]|uniref:hypothetical protein n=1 Tax=Pseudomonas sp. QE6 TaxID=3242491 RepID=UPI0035281A46